MGGGTRRRVWRVTRTSTGLPLPVSRGSWVGVFEIMTLYILRRLFGFLVTLLIAAAVIFLLLDLLPGDPARFILGINATPESVAALRLQMGLDDPAIVRFSNWLLGMLRGDFGLSQTQKLPVAGLIADRMAVTLPLTIFAWSSPWSLACRSAFWPRATAAS